MRPHSQVIPSLETARSDSVTTVNSTRTRSSRCFNHKLGLLAKGTLRALRTGPSALVWFFVQVLMRVAPDGAYYRQRIGKRSREYASSQLFTGRYGYRIILIAVSLYRRSFLHNYLHRSGYPCLFIPSCSEYAIRAAQKYGFWRGLMLIGDRFRRCDPSYRGAWIDFP
jgi:putative component of membrane protein insertase Oxa1/YidC/SpoIIIJ protein YidD